MKKYAFTLTVSEEYAQPILKHAFLLRCMPGTYPFQRSYAHRLTISPHAALSHIFDAYGNEMYTGTIDKAHSSFSFTASGFVLSSKYLTHEPLDRLYLYPTRKTQASPGVAPLLSGLPEDPWARAKALCALTHRLLHLGPTAPQLTPAQVLAQGQGDAKDLAHVFLSLCRQAGLGARFVSGLALGVPQVHAWAEVYCGGLWRGLDPTTGLPAEDGYLKIAHGPDFDACTISRSCYRDSATPATRQVLVQVTEHVVGARDTVPHA